jgi:uncharacterized membrane protein YeaQ/YmgE (transglycosylase-associated protein family)
MGLEIVLSWIGAGMAAGYLANMLRRDRLPLFENLSFAGVGAALGGLIGWMFAFGTPGAPLIAAIVGALAAVAMVPRYTEPTARRKGGWFATPH